jgi:hypothetical protein
MNSGVPRRLSASPLNSAPFQRVAPDVALSLRAYTYSTFNKRLNFVAAAAIAAAAALCSAAKL